MGSWNLEDLVWVQTRRRLLGLQFLLRQVTLCSHLSRIREESQVPIYGIIFHPEVTAYEWRFFTFIKTLTVYLSSDCKSYAKFVSQEKSWLTNPQFISCGWQFSKIDIVVLKPAIHSILKFRDVAGCMCQNMRTQRKCTKRCTICNMKPEEYSHCEFDPLIDLGSCELGCPIGRSQVLQRVKQIKDPFFKSWCLLTRAVSTAWHHLNKEIVNMLTTGNMLLKERGSYRLCNVFLKFLRYQAL